MNARSIQSLVFAAILSICTAQTVCFYGTSPCVTSTSIHCCNSVSEYCNPSIKDNPCQSLSNLVIQNPNVPGVLFQPVNGQFLVPIQQLPPPTQTYYSSQPISTGPAPKVETAPSYSKTAYPPLPTFTVSPPSTGPINTSPSVPLAGEGCDSQSRCGGKDLCCKDFKLGELCFGASNANCIRDEKGQTMLCAMGNQACGGVCYDVKVNRCSNGNIV